MYQFSESVADMTSGVEHSLCVKSQSISKQVDFYNPWVQRANSQKNKFTAGFLRIAPEKGKAATPEYLQKGPG